METLTQDEYIKICEHADELISRGYTAVPFEEIVAKLEANKIKQKAIDKRRQK